MQEDEAVSHDRDLKIRYWTDFFANNRHHIEEPRILRGRDICQDGGGFIQRQTALTPGRKWEGENAAAKQPSGHGP